MHSPRQLLGPGSRKEHLPLVGADQSGRKPLSALVDDLVEIAKRAKEEGYTGIAQKALNAAVKLDPEHAGAREALGYKKVDGKWLKEREWKLKEGWKEDPKTRELLSPEEWKEREERKKREASAGDRPTAELERRLRDPVALTLDASMLVATLAIVALMVWKP